MPCKFKPGDLVYVQDVRNSIWLPAMVVLAWKQATLPEGLIGEVYDVEGRDEMGEFHGRWDERYIKPRSATP